jgi:hypothetical protein
VPYHGKIVLHHGLFPYINIYILIFRFVFFIVWVYRTPSSNSTADAGCSCMRTRRSLPTSRRVSSSRMAGSTSLAGVGWTCSSRSTKGPEDDVHHQVPHELQRRAGM